ncbi:glycerol-3-phosphate dehydrogenase [NAD(+)], cytoplasmic-like [Artemia franciscana]|uniref:Glycerol-3-phosphate dehydrogenase [NAD(+)] n=1 Tax=Artemia franciscana TaxID=6661 RepID=A0AA88I4W0_ARTSF|nr:hypothetical protein QYM36_004005 [Artemia franciscana]
MKRLKVSIIGSGSWGCAISKIVGKNVLKRNTFDKRVSMWVYEEIIEGRNLSEIINSTHENVKYLKGHKLPETVVATPDLVEAITDVDILIFVLPHQFLKRCLDTLEGKIKSTAVAISLIKGFQTSVDGDIELISKYITSRLKIQCSVLMGANIANEVANEVFCEGTIGCATKEMKQTFKELFETNYFRVAVVDDTQTVEACGALKNIVACAAGFSDGLLYGNCTKTAIIRIGLMEIKMFINTFLSGSEISTFFESCGISDLFASCYGGRNRKCSALFVEKGKSIYDLEKEILNGQRLQGPSTAEAVNIMLMKKGLEKKFPLFTAVHRIFNFEISPRKLLDHI